MGSKLIGSKRPGELVKLNDGRLGRTYNGTGFINGKVAVYLATETKEYNGITIPVKYSEKAVLKKLEDFQRIGFID